MQSSFNGSCVLPPFQRELCAAPVQIPFVTDGQLFFQFLQPLIYTCMGHGTWNKVYLIPSGGYIVVYHMVFIYLRTTTQESFQIVLHI